MKCKVYRESYWYNYRIYECDSLEDLIDTLDKENPNSWYSVSKRPILWDDEKNNFDYYIGINDELAYEVYTIKRLTRNGKDITYIEVKEERLDKRRL